MSWKSARREAMKRLPFLIEEAQKLEREFDGRARVISLTIYPDEPTYRLAHMDSPWGFEFHAMVNRVYARELRKLGYKVKLETVESNANSLNP